MNTRFWFLLLLSVLIGSLYCKPKVSFYLSTYGIGSESIYLNDLGIGSDRTIAIVGLNSQPDVIICLGSSTNSTHDVSVSNTLNMDAIDVHFSDFSIGCDHDLYITDFAISEDIKYAFTDNPQLADLVINLQDSTLSLNKKQLVALIDTFAPQFLKRH